MAEAKDPAIKLFGKTIQLPDTASDDGGGGADCGVSSSANGAVEERESNEEDKDVSEVKPVDKEEDGSHLTMSAETKDPITNSMLNYSLETPSAENESATAKIAKTSKTVEEEQSDTSDSQEKTLKKPDKILPCPRCNSMETKFCYFNNYNVSQPRHFCKNCQRYWTAGGTMRNVPVGAGRRKNKATTAQYRQTTATEGLPSGLEPSDSVTKTAEKPVGPNGFPKPEFPSNGDGNPHGPSVNRHGFSPQVPWFPGGPWAYPWNPQTGPPGFPIPMSQAAYPWNPQTGPPPGPPGFPIPMPFYPAAPYWACGPWNLPWIAPNTTPHPGPNPTNPRKHSREENTEKDSEPEKRLWIPKTLRIDDPDEAAKSSIWSTLGIKNDRVDSGGFFKTLESKGEEKTASMKETTCVLQANPAALSRSLHFHEGS